VEAHEVELQKKTWNHR